MRVAAVAATSDLNLQAHGMPLLGCMHGTRQELVSGAQVHVVAIAATWGLKWQAHDETRHGQQALELTVGAPQSMS